MKIVEEKDKSYFEEMLKPYKDPIWVHGYDLLGILST